MKMADTNKFKALNNYMEFDHENRSITCVMRKNTLKLAKSKPCLLPEDDLNMLPAPSAVEVLAALQSTTGTCAFKLHDMFP